MFEFKKPDLSSFEDATDEQKALADKYTRIRECVVDDTPDAHTSWLKVEQQSFAMSGYEETAGEASWTCWMLAKAIETILATEDKP